MAGSVMNEDGLKWLRAVPGDVYDAAAQALALPQVGQHVGQDAEGDWLYVLARDVNTHQVRLGVDPNDPASAGPWTTWGYDEAHIPTERLGCNPPASAESLKCECGSGSDELSGAHSHWCRRYLAP